MWCVSIGLILLFPFGERFLQRALLGVEAAGVHAAGGVDGHDAPRRQTVGAPLVDACNLLGLQVEGLPPLRAEEDRHVAHAVACPETPCGGIHLEVILQVEGGALPMQGVAQGGDEAPVGLMHQQVVLPTTYAGHPVLVVGVGDGVEFLVEGCCPSAYGAPVVGGGVDAVAVSGNPSAVGGEHVDVVDALLAFEGGVAQGGEGAAAVGAEKQQAVLRACPHPSSLAAPSGMEPLLPLHTFVGYALPCGVARRGAQQVFLEAHGDGGVAVEGHHTFQVDVAPNVFLLHQRPPRGADAVGLVDVAAHGADPYRTVGRHRGLASAFHLEVHAPVALLGLYLPCGHKGGDDDQDGLFHNLFIVHVNVSIVRGLSGWCP